MKGLLGFCPKNEKWRMVGASSHSFFNMRQFMMRRGQLRFPIDAALTKRQACPLAFKQNTQMRQFMLCLIG